MNVLRNKLAPISEGQILTTKRSVALIEQGLTRPGFTLVEVIIVLAIVGLIFVIIFLAVTAAQRGQRDTARKDNVNRLYAVIQQTLGNLGGGTLTPTTTLAGFTINSPAVAICNTACADKTHIEWAAGACPTPGGGTTGHVEIKLDDTVTIYCKDY